MALAEQTIAPHEEEGYNPQDRTAAWVKAQEWGERIPIGIVYRGEPIPTYGEQVPALKAGPLVQQPLERLRLEQIEALRAEIV